MIYKLQLVKKTLLESVELSKTTFKLNYIHQALYLFDYLIQRQ